MRPAQQELDAMPHAGRTLRHLIRQTGHSVRQVAAAAGVSHAALNTALSSPHPIMRADTLDAVLDTLGTSTPDYWRMVAVDYTADEPSVLRVRLLDDLVAFNADQLLEMIAYARMVKTAAGNGPTPRP
jgi:lambda repressor-like predicted transcriptional regulator